MKGRLTARTFKRSMNESRLFSRILITVLTLGLTSLAVAGQPETSGRTPLLFRQRHFDAAILADAVNVYVDLGESEARRKLKSIAQKDTYGKIGFEINDRSGLVCRVLYEPREDPLGGPAFGALALPKEMTNTKDWPRYPIAKSGITFFVLSDGYSLLGKAETVEHYLEYCQSHGAFRTERVEVPSRAVAIRDVAELRTSKRWLTVKWKGGGPDGSYGFDEEKIWRFIARQAVSIPRQSSGNAASQNKPF